HGGSPARTRSMDEPRRTAMSGRGRSDVRVMANEQAPAGVKALSPASEPPAEPDPGEGQGERGLQAEVGLSALARVVDPTGHTEGEQAGADDGARLTDADRTEPAAPARADAVARQRGLREAAARAVEVAPHAGLGDGEGDGADAEQAGADEGAGGAAAATVVRRAVAAVDDASAGGEA